MKNKIKLLAIIIVLALIASCVSSGEEILDNTEISNFTFSPGFQDAEFISFNAQVNTSDFVSSSGEFTSRGDIYNFDILNNHFSYLKIDDVGNVKIDSIPMNELISVIDNTNDFLYETFKMQKYNLKLFVANHHISIIDSRQLVYSFSNGVFRQLDNITEISEMCLLIYGEGTALIILIS